MPDALQPSADDRAAHLRWLLHLTQLPTAAGREHHVIEWITRWAAQRPLVAVTSDAGGVMDAYFTDASVMLHSAPGPVRARLTGRQPQAAASDLFPIYTAVTESPHHAAPGDVAVWDVPPAEVTDGRVHTLACDDLAALAAALAAFDALLRRPPTECVRLLLTRAEEVGFVGAIGACRHSTIPRGARLIALENSRAFADSPLGGGPIVRVGDRLSIFSPGLTAAIAKRAEEHAAANPGWKWQRKLMAGGACEASVFCQAGFEATCVCLPLGNYHNMGDLDAVQAGTNATPPRVAREYIATSDFEGLVDLLIACGERLGAGPSLAERFDKLWEQRRVILGPQPRA
ncbi:MAG: hypothetical protein DYG92_06560 [Leptolyngbya sp. PLA1]|nr:hypothetical protein [Leptolyngbya sp. PLA1]